MLINESNKPVEEIVTNFCFVSFDGGGGGGGGSRGGIRGGTTTLDVEF